MPAVGNSCGASDLPGEHGSHEHRAGRTPVTQARLVLLGTKGGPRLVDTRKTIGTLLLINDVPYLVDCGYGTSNQLVAAGVTLDRIRYVFLTHHHSDHLLDYGPLVYNAWIEGVRSQVDAYGPPPLETATAAFWEYVKIDVDTRIVDEGRIDPRPLLVVHEFDGPGTVLSNDDVTVTSARVIHPPIEHAYAFRFDTDDRSIVISGDTTYAPELVALATGADVLVHEVMHLPALDRLLARNPRAATLREHLVASHTVPEDVGRVAAEAQVKTVVLTHFVPGDDPGITDEMWSEGVRKHFGGRVIVGKDLMEI